MAQEKNTRHLGTMVSLITVQLGVSKLEENKITNSTCVLKMHDMSRLCMVRQKLH